MIFSYFEVAIPAAGLVEFPCFLLTFPDTSFLIDRTLNSETEMLKFSEKMKVLQVQYLCNTNSIIIFFQIFTCWFFIYLNYIVCRLIFP